MTSKTIYTNLPYVYRLDHPTTGEFYIGYRSANKKPSYQDLPEYKTSSKIVKSRFDEFNWTILAEFFIGEDAYDFEQLTIFENWNNPLILNNSCYYGKARLRNNGHSEETKAKLSAARQGFTFSEESKAKISSSHIGKTLSIEHRAKLCIARIGKSSPNKGKKSSTETKAKLSAIHFGSKRSDETKASMSAWQKGVPKEVVDCPHCSKSGGISNMKRYHFDNCKFKSLPLE